MLSCEPAPEAAPTRVEIFAATGALADPWSPTRPGEELVFSRSQLREADGALAAEETRGQMTDAIFQRAARPWSHFSEPHLYNEVIEVVEQPDGSRVQHHRVTREPNPRRILPGARATTTPELSEEVQALVRDADPATREGDPATREGDPATRVMLSARLADVPEWDIPLIPPEDLVGPEAVQSALEERARAFDRREAAIRRARAAVMEDLRTLDARVEDEDRASAWIRFEVPSEAVAALALDPRFSRVVVPHDEAQANQVCDQGCWDDLDDDGFWYLGETGDATKLNYDAHHAFGYEGDIANTQWHGTTYGRLLLGVIDLSSLEDESPAFSNRIFGRWNCNSVCVGTLTWWGWCDGWWLNTCPTLSNFNDSEGVTCSPASTNCDNAGYHGTSVSGIVLANYDHAGSSGLQLGDECYSTPFYSVHCDTWKQRSKGIAPQAGLMYFRLASTREVAWEMAIDRAIEQKVDVLNISVGDGEGNYSNRCKLTLNTAYEDNLENAFDDGIFVVNSSGNYGSPDPNWYQPTECLINSISSKPKVFSVASVLIDQALPYNTMDRNQAGSYAGGVDVKIDGVSTTNQPVSIVDLVAPSSGHLVTTCNGTNGMTEDISLFGGSSGAAPHVAGSALLVKHRLLANGHTWVNSPGRLHTVMLAMGDRAENSTPYRRKQLGTNYLWGMGRLKLSMFPTYMMRTDSFTVSSTTPVRSRIFTNGMQTNRKFVKCVFLQDEDMSSKSLDDQVSQVRLRLIVVPRPPEQAGQTCPTQPSTLIGAAIIDDNSADIKKMVSATSVDLAQGLIPLQGISQLPNACLYIEHTPLHVTPQAITTHTFCYQSEVRDDQGI